MRRYSCYSAIKSMIHLYNKIHKGHIDICLSVRMQVFGGWWITPGGLCLSDPQNGCSWRISPRSWMWIWPASLTWPSTSCRCWRNLGAGWWTWPASLVDSLSSAEATASPNGEWRPSPTASGSGYSLTYLDENRLKLELNLCVFCSGGTCSTLGSEWASLNQVSSRQPWPASMLLKPIWRGCGTDSVKILGTRMDFHTSMNVRKIYLFSGRGSWSCVPIKHWSHQKKTAPFTLNKYLFYFHFDPQMWSLRASPWASCAVQISLRWPGAWNTRWRLVSHALATAPAGMPSYSGFLCPTSLHLFPTLWSTCSFLRLKLEGTGNTFADSAVMPAMCNIK